MQKSKTLPKEEEEKFDIWLEASKEEQKHIECNFK